VLLTLGAVMPAARSIRRKLHARHRAAASEPTLRGSMPVLKDVMNFEGFDPVVASGVSETTQLAAGQHPRRWCHRHYQHLRGTFSHFQYINAGDRWTGTDYMLIAGPAFGLGEASEQLTLSFILDDMTRAMFPMDAEHQTPMSSPAPLEPDGSTKAG
jgi:hypothetical protein